MLFLSSNKLCRCIQKWYALHVLCKCRYKSNMYMTFLFQNVICDIYKYIYIHQILRDILCYRFLLCVLFRIFYLRSVLQFHVYFLLSRISDIFSWNLFKHVFRLILSMFKIIVTIGETGFENRGNLIKLKNCTDKNKNAFRNYS